MESREQAFFEFGTYRLEPRERLLLKDGKPVALTALVFDLLLTLVENAGETVDKDTLMRRMWPDTFVEDGNLHHYISSLRKTLGDDHHNQQVIKTIPKRGYQFTGNVQRVTRTAKVDLETRSRVVITE